MGKVIPVYASTESAQELERVFHYAFFPDGDYQGGAAPQLTLNRLAPYQPVLLGGRNFMPLPVQHGKMEVYGYRVADFAYITDCSSIPNESAQHLQNLQVLILDGLRSRAHPTHFSHEQAVRVAEELKPERCYLTHISHEVDHYPTNAQLARMTKRHVELAYDRLEIELP